MFPFIFVLMTRRTQEAYSHLIKYINTDLIDIQPASIITDYEVAMRNALRLAYPDADMKACWFHHCQAVKRHGSQISGFMAVARKTSKAADIYYQLLCLPLLPANEITTVFNIIKIKAIEQFGKLFDPFLDYYERQWLKKVIFLSLNLVDNYINFLFLFLFSIVAGRTTENFGVWLHYAHNCFSRSLQLRVKRTH